VNLPPGEHLSKNVELVAYHDLEGRPGFKMGLAEVGGRWFLYLGLLWHRGWAIVDVTDPTTPRYLRWISGPANTWTIQVQVAAGTMVTALEKIDHGWGERPDEPFEEGLIVWDLSDPEQPTPLGRFVTGGPMGDTGLTGRKIIVDTYGGSCPHGGGAFSGKDPTKVDRSACYMARHVAKNIVAAGLARRAQVQVAYAIGVADPVSIMVDTFGTGKVPNAVLEQLIRRHFDFTPTGIIKYLDLRRPIYKKTAAYGHFGRAEPEFGWERVDRVKDLRDDAGV